MAVKISKEKVLFETYFDQSVQGLSVGSPVKYRGVEIGSVDDITLVTREYHLDPADADFHNYLQYVMVKIALEPNTFGEHPLKDIQELFRLERHYSFQKFFELLMAQSGGIFEATRFAKICEVSRTTISNYLKVLESTFVVHIVRPFTTHKITEIVSAPKVYGFDTGFICYHRGIIALRLEDYGFLWEHFVLNELHSQLQTKNIFLS